MFRTFLLLSLLFVSLKGMSFDTTQVLRYTEALSEKMEFPGVTKRFNGDFLFSDEDMAFFKVLSIKADYMQIEKEGGMNTNLYTFQIYQGKKKNYITAINLRSGSSGRCKIRCYEISMDRGEIVLEDAPKSLHSFKWADFELNETVIKTIEENPDLIYLGYEFDASKNLIASVHFNPPFGKENQKISEGVMKESPGIMEAKLQMTWTQKKSRFILVPQRSIDN